MVGTYFHFSGCRKTSLGIDWQQQGHFDTFWSKVIDGAFGKSALEAMKVIRVFAIPGAYLLVAESNLRVPSAVDASE